MPDLITPGPSRRCWPKKRKYGALPLTAAGAHCSERERSAADAEHKSVDILRAELLKTAIGTVMDGTVTSVIDSGTFVMLGDTGAEGMLRVANLKPGDKIKVIVDAVDTIEGKIDLSLAEKPGQMPAQIRVKPAAGPHRPPAAGGWRGSGSSGGGPRKKRRRGRR